LLKERDGCLGSLIWSHVEALDTSGAAVNLTLNARKTRFQLVLTAMTFDTVFNTLLIESQLKVTLVAARFVMIFDTTCTQIVVAIATSHG